MIEQFQNWHLFSNIFAAVDSLLQVKVKIWIKWGVNIMHLDLGGVQCSASRCGRLIYVETTPVTHRALATRAGLGVTVTRKIVSRPVFFRVLT
jgi:hypothetical protein